jgi:ABC-type sulfate transport system permease subunit
LERASALLEKGAIKPEPTDCTSLLADSITAWVAGNIIGKTQTLTLFVESAYKEYNTEAAFAAAVLLSLLALMTLWVKDRVEKAAAAEAAK